LEIAMVEVGEGVREMSMKKELALHLGTDQLLRDVDNFVNGTAQTSKGGRRSDSWHSVWRPGNYFILNFFELHLCNLNWACNRLFQDISGKCHLAGHIHRTPNIFTKEDRSAVSTPPYTSELTKHKSPALMFDQE
jgi:hypothetical protein